MGVKTEGRDWSAGAAVFHLRRGLTHVGAANVFTQDGESRYQGLELSSKMHLTRQWLATGSLLLLDATAQKTSGGALDGKRIPV